MSERLKVDKNSRAEQAPFIEGSGESEESLRVRFPDLYIKYRSFHLADDELEKGSTVKRIEILKQSRALWHELGNPNGRYKLALPKVEYVVSHEPTELLEPLFTTHMPEEMKPGYYCVSERVEGRPLIDELNDNSSELTVNELEDLVCHLADYYWDKLQSGEAFVADMGIKQFMYGHLVGDPDNKRIFLVDQEPFFGTAIESDSIVRGWALRGQAHALVRMVETIQKRTGEILYDASQRVLALLEALPPNPHGDKVVDPTPNYIEKMRLFT